jgi:S1-C subfamily serine protease
MIILLVFSLYLELNSIKYGKFKKKRSKDFENLIEKLKKSVVMIDINSEFQIGSENSTSSSKATGFIVDSALGIVVTNKHVTRISPTTHRITLIDGSVHRGKVIYYDFYHDFGFIKLESKNLNNLSEVILGSSQGLKKGDSLMLIGNNEGVNWSIKYGNVIDPNVSEFSGFGSIIQTSFDRTGGSSGSPVWNEQGEVVAIHAMGDNSYSFEVPVEYIKMVLEKIRSNRIADKGFIGVFTDLSPLFKIEESLRKLKIDASDLVKRIKSGQVSNKKYLNQSSNDTLKVNENVFTSPNITKKNIDSYEKSTSLPQVIKIQSVLPDSPAYNILRGGDIILQINDRVLANDFILYDKILDENINKNLTFTVFRFNKILNISFIVSSTEKEKVYRILSFSGITLHDINFYVKLFFPYLEKGIFVSKIISSSPMSNYWKNGPIIIRSINSQKIESLDDFLKVMIDSGCQRESTYIEAMSLEESFPRFRTYSLDFGIEDTISEFNFSDHAWRNNIIKLSKCISKRRSPGDIIYDPNNDKKTFWSKEIIEENYTKLKLSLS